MKTSKLLIGIGIASILTLVIFFGHSLPIGAQEKCVIVTIQSKAGISPETLHIKKGDCVVWINRTLGEDVKINFKEGKKCQEMTKSAVGFKMDWNSCYVTDYLDFGRTSSLLFDHAGTFRYEVEFKSRTGEGTRIGTARFGTIIVE